MPTSKNIVSRSKVKMSSMFRKVGAAASHMLHRQNSRARATTSRASVHHSSTPAVTLNAGEAPAVVQPFSQSILQYVSTNYMEGSSIADVSLTDSDGSPSASLPSASDQGGATSGPGLYYREYTLLGQRRAADNCALWPIDSPLTSTSQPRIPGSRPVPSGQDQSANQQNSPSPHSNRNGSPLPQACGHEPHRSVSDSVNAQVFGLVPTRNDECEAPAIPGLEGPQPDSFEPHSGGSAAWSHRTPQTPVDNFVVGGPRRLSDPFVSVPAVTPQRRIVAVSNMSPISRRWSDFDSDEFPSTGSKRLVRVTSERWELRRDSARRWSDFDSDKFPNSGGKVLARVGSEQWELRTGDQQPEVAQAPSPPAQQATNVASAHEQGEGFNINDPHGHQPLERGALAGDWSLPSMTRSQHLRHTERGLFAAQNAQPAIRGLRYAVDRAATDFQALRLENQALRRMADEYRFKTLRILEPELIRAWEALRERDAEIARLRRIISSNQAPQAENVESNADTGADTERAESSPSLRSAAFSYQGHHQYNAGANPSSVPNPSRAAQPLLQTPPGQMYGEAVLVPAVFTDSDCDFDSESWYDSDTEEAGDMYGS